MYMHLLWRFETNSFVISYPGNSHPSKLLLNQYCALCISKWLYPDMLLMFFVPFFIYYANMPVPFSSSFLSFCIYYYKIQDFYMLMFVTTVRYDTYVLLYKDICFFKFISCITIFYLIFFFLILNLTNFI